MSSWLICKIIGSKNTNEMTVNPIYEDGNDYDCPESQLCGSLFVLHK